ncbi:hypothetical protein M3Y98_00868900 [Aphelenchoides besseyi]|nr:hypothetical protein M3Y98_00868900 [Aphelenchoides besseyi]KAI6211261.1 hypothetical protein M3Y96_00414900 [Aphelenchoides besseyi]
MPELKGSLPNLHSAIRFMRPQHQKSVSFGLSCCKYDNVSRLKAFKKFDYLVVNGNLLQAYQYFHPYKTEIRHLMKFGNEVQTTVRQIAQKLFRDDTSHKLCVHTRVGDFKKHFLLESRLNFTNPAVQFVFEKLAEEYKDVSIVLLGLDTEFIDSIVIPSNARYVYKPQNLTRYMDLHLGSTYCDSLLLTASGSTFGFWIGYLMSEDKQNRIFYNIETAKRLSFGKNVYDYDSFPHKWNRLRLWSNGSIAHEPRWHFQIRADEPGTLGGEI